MREKTKQSIIRLITVVIIGLFLLIALYMLRPCFLGRARTNEEDNMTVRQNSENLTGEER
jgi:hypothetical protein